MVLHFFGHCLGSEEDDFQEVAQFCLRITSALAIDKGFLCVLSSCYC